MLCYCHIGFITFSRTLFPAKAPGRSRTRLNEASSPFAEQQRRRSWRPCSLEMRAQGGFLCRGKWQGSSQPTKLSGDFGRKKCRDPNLWHSILLSAKNSSSLQYCSIKGYECQVFDNIVIWDGFLGQYVCSGQLLFWGYSFVLKNEPACWKTTERMSLTDYWPIFQVWT